MMHLLHKKASHQVDKRIEPASTPAVALHETKLKIYGERNSGTTYLRQLLAANVQATLLPGTAPRIWRRLARGQEWPIDLYFHLTAAKNLGWKHQLVLPPTRGRSAHYARPGVKFIVITKNPYAWLLSLFRHPYHYQGQRSNFETFLQQPWATVRRENHPQPFANPIAMWNAKHEAYLRLLRQQEGVLLRYEALLADPEAQLTHLTKTLQLTCHPYFIPVQNDAKGESVRKFSDYQIYYLEQHWRQELDARHIDLINRTLNQNLVTSMGYELLSA